MATSPLINPLARALAAGALCALAACGGDDDAVDGELEIAGTWASNFGFDETISAAMWGDAIVVEYDNAANSAITQNAADAQFDPGKFNKITWTEPSGGRFYYCTVDFGLESVEAARSTQKTADASSPETGGCGTFSWTRLARPIEVAGSYDSNFGGVEEISSHAWGMTSVREYDNDGNWAVVQNPSDDMFNPSAFAKIVWTEPSGGSFYYCYVDFGLATLEAARTSTQTTDATNPDDSGCGGFSWTKLDAR